MEATRHQRTRVSFGWKRSSRCGPDGGDCVEVDLLHAGKVAVRRSTRILGSSTGLLLFDPGKWRTFIDLTRDGRF